MSAVIQLGTSTGSVKVIAAVRDAVNERARFIGASDEERRHAVNSGIQAVTCGRSPAIAISDALRLLQGKPPAVKHGGYPTPPEAA